MTARNLQGTRVFFGCSMRGGQEIVSREELRALKDGLRELGIIFVSEHQTQEGILEQEEKLLPVQIHDRDWEFEEEAQVGVFEISNPSTGAGGEISDMLNMGRPVICLIHSRVDEKSRSRYILGKEGSRHVVAPFVCEEYLSVKHATTEVRNFILRYVAE